MPDFDIVSPKGEKFRITAPDGTTADQALAYFHDQRKQETIAKLKADTPGEYDSSSKEYKAKFGPEATARADPLMEGFGSGLTRFSRGTGNLLRKAMSVATPSAKDLANELIGDDALKEQDRLDKPLSEDLLGSVGQIAGQTAASLPLSLGLGTASTAARAVPYAGKVLGSTLGRLGLEGAINGATTADPDQQGQGAALGGALGIGLGAGGKLAGGLIKKSQAAQDLEHLANQQGKDIFIPVGQAADEGDVTSRLAKAVYKEGLPLIPGTMGRFKGQSDRALQTVREMALSEADPTGNVIAAGSGKDSLGARRALKDTFNSEYDNTIKQYSFNVPSDFKDQVATRIKAEMPNVDKETLEKVSSAIADKMERFSSGAKSIDGGNLLNAKTSSNALYGEMEGPERIALAHGIGAYDDLIENELKQGGSPGNLADLARFQGLAEPYGAFKQVSKAVQSAKANSGNFNPAQLARASSDPGTLLHLGTTANEVLGKPVAQPSTAGRVAAYSLGALGGYHNPVMLAGAVGGANALSTETVQRALMGDLRSQRALNEFVRKNPGQARVVAAAIRGMMETQAGDHSRASP